MMHYVQANYELTLCSFKEPNHNVDYDRCPRLTPVVFLGWLHRALSHPEASHPHWSTEQRYYRQGLQSSKIYNIFLDEMRLFDYSTMLFFCPFFY